MAGASISRRSFLKISGVTIAGLPSLGGTVDAAESTKKPHILLDNNWKVLDLTDLVAEFPTDITETITPILTTTEKWEISLNRDPELAPLTYPTVVKNDRGPNPDHKYYLYYAHHDIASGIGCAIADNISGPYKKLAELDASRIDSQVLKGPRHDLYRENSELLRRSPELRRRMIVGPHRHLSSPCVVWNPKQEIWHLYFHSDRGGRQETYLATCRDLSTNEWEILKNPDGTWNIVLPVTAEKWMDSTSSYHNICVLPNGTFLAFLNGRGGGYVDGQWRHGGLGFATSQDGINWNYFQENPIIEGELRGLANGLIGYLGDGEYLVLWSEKWDLFYGKTRDFKTITRDPRGPAKWKAGSICPWREGNKVYFFTHGLLHIMELPVRGQ